MRKLSPSTFDRLLNQLLLVALIGVPGANDLRTKEDKSAFIFAHEQMMGLAIHSSWVHPMETLVILTHSAVRYR